MVTDLKLLCNRHLLLCLKELLPSFRNEKVPLDKSWLIRGVCIRMNIFRFCFFLFCCSFVFVSPTNASSLKLKIIQRSGKLIMGTSEESIFWGGWEDRVEEAFIFYQ